MRNKRKKSSKKLQNVGALTQSRLLAMKTLASSDKIRLLYEASSKTYFVFNGAYNRFFVGNSYKDCKRKFHQLTINA